jgi:(4S)-4-hydroxy-5-phosphonooxypentane-2,3-dione isomerase
MIVTCVYVHVKPDHVDQFLNATIVNHKESIKEPGNLRFDFLQQPDDPCHFMIYEAYDSEESASAHKDTAHYLQWRDNVANWMAEPRKGVRYHIIVPKDKTEW